MGYKLCIKKYAPDTPDVPDVLPGTGGTDGGPLRIGLDMPGWLPDGAQTTFKLVLGGLIGITVGVYSLSLALVVDRIATSVTTGQGSELSYHAVNLAALVIGAVALHHALARRQDRTGTDL